MNLLETLNWATHWLERHGIENPRLDAELLLARSLNLSREELYVHLRGSVEKKEKKNIEELIRRRISGEPLQYILGHQEFWSIDLRVDSRVLIPRPETELLVEEAVSILSVTSLGRRPVVLDLGTGSGAIAIALAKEIEDIFLVATDISWNAVNLARQNAADVGVSGKIAFAEGDLFDPFRPSEEKDLFDLILSNPPYIVRSEMKHLAREVKDYEPGIALDGGEDGLDFYRRIVSQSPAFLRKRGWLLLEIGQNQEREVTRALVEGGSFSDPELLQDLAGIKRVVKVQKKCGSRW